MDTKSDRTAPGCTAKGRPGRPAVCRGVILPAIVQQTGSIAQTDIAFGANGKGRRRPSADRTIVLLRPTIGVGVVFPEIALVGCGCAAQAIIALVADGKGHAVYPHSAREIALLQPLVRRRIVLPDLRYPIPRAVDSGDQVPVAADRHGLRPVRHQRQIRFPRPDIARRIVGPHFFIVPAAAIALPSAHIGLAVHHERKPKGPFVAAIAGLLGPGALGGEVEGKQHC